MESTHYRRGLTNIIYCHLPKEVKVVVVVDVPPTTTTEWVVLSVAPRITTVS